MGRTGGLIVRASKEMRLMTHHGNWRQIATGLALTTGLITTIGCSDKPHSYGQARPPVDQIDDRDRGLQSKEVVNASDLLVQKILRLPEFNGPNRRPVVVTAIQNH